MQQSTYKSIVSCFNVLAVDYTNYEALLQCYIYAVLTIKKEEGLFSKHVCDAKFESMCYRYGMAERPKFIDDAFALLSRYAKELEDAFNPWEEFQRSIKGNNAITGVSLEETVFNAVARILKEKPSDVVRATLYPYPELFGKKGGRESHPITTADLSAHS